MKIYLMTDMEGCAGILNHDDWVLPSGRYYDAGRRILTDETNAAIDGFFAEGATEIVVVDGHGAGGIDPLRLDSRAQLQRGYRGEPVYPFGLDRSFHAAAWVGQHAKAGTDDSHITHTGWFGTIDDAINGLSIGEYGQIALCAKELGVPSILACGEAALDAEVQAVSPGAVTVAVKRGLKKDGLDHLSAEDYGRAKLDAIHYSPAEAGRRIRAGAIEALRRLKTQPASFRYADLRPPYSRTIKLRAHGQNPPKIEHFEDAQSLIAVMNGPFKSR